MDKNVISVLDKRVERTINNLKTNNINAYYLENKEALHLLLDELIIDKEVVSVGGSMTLFETQTLDYLRARDLEFLDRYEAGLSGQDIKQLYRDSFSCDSYFTSSNAITEAGELYNVDGNGNRVAAMIYGPDKVIVITGVNKIVKDLDEAIKRNREIAAPANVQRLNRKTPCYSTGYCTDCKSADKICRAYTVISSQVDPNRMHVIFLNEQLGY